MRKFFDPKPSLLKPADLVSAITGKKAGELNLPKRAIVVFNAGDLKGILNKKKHRLIKEWSGFRLIYGLEGSDTVITRSYYGGPNIASLVEELSSFGVGEFVLWGYCGGIGRSLKIGDVIIARGALREDGISYHYIDGMDEIVYTDWFDEWERISKERGFSEGIIWSSDAIYRETGDKIIRYGKKGIAAVEMETASFYAVCLYRKVKGIVFLVVSDLLRDESWISGFHTAQLKNGARKLSKFISEAVVY